MTLEQLTEIVLGNTKNIAENSKTLAGIHESLKSAHKRIDDNDRITEGIHKLAANVESLTMQVKHLTERMEKGLQSLEAQQRVHGEQIRVLEGKPGKKWEAVVEKVILVAVGGVVAFMMTRIGM